MGRVRVAGFALSLDGFGAGPDQSLDQPLGLCGPELMGWLFPTKTFRTMIGQEGGSDGVDESFARRAMDGFGAFILGRNMFGPIRGNWPDEEWKGWWGDDPVFHTPVVVLTHHPRPVLEMQGGTTFHFLDADPATALEHARALAGDLDVRIGGGASTVRQFLEADLVDRMHLVLVPVLLGRGERLWDGLEGLEDRFAVEAAPSPSGVVHLTFSRRD